MIQKSMPGTPGTSPARRPRGLRALAGPLALAVLLAATPAAQASDAASGRSAHPPKAKGKGSVRIKPSQNGSQETPAQRDRRLQRECRGLPNAGACLGYARP